MKVATISVTKESKPLGVNFIGRDCECNITIPSKVRLCKYYLSLFFFVRNIAVLYRPNRVVYVLVEKHSLFGGTLKRTTNH